MNAGLKQWLPWIAVGVMALILGVVAVANNGDSDTVAGDTTTTVPETTSTALETSTTEPPETTTTTVSPETTTTTVPPGTTTTSTSPASTTIPVELVVELSDEGVQAGAEWVYFGFDDDEAVIAVAAVLGAPTHDSGWVDSFSVYGTCPSPVVRGVHWDGFVMLFTQADTHFWSGGVPHFFGYYFTDPQPDLFTTQGIGIESSVEALEAAYGGPLYTMDESFFDPENGFWTYDQQAWSGLWGYTTGQSPTDAITSINGGQGCGE